LFESRSEFEVIGCVDMFPRIGITPLVAINIRVGRNIPKQKMIVGADSAGQLYVNCVRLHSYKGLQ
jgi:hypothetical protein